MSVLIRMQVLSDRFFLEPLSRNGVINELFISLGNVVLHQCVKNTLMAGLY